jgi:hypothetical protein
MNSKIIVKIVRVYDKDLIYPVSDNGIFLARIAGTKTLTHVTVMLAKNMGFTFEVEKQNV